MSLKIASAACAALALVAASTGARAADDKSFIEDAIKANNSEIALGNLAIQKAGRPAAKSFGRMLVRDHTKGKREAESLARKIGADTSNDMVNEAQAEQTKLNGLSGAEFDREFAAYMVSDHEKDIAHFQDEAKTGKGPVAAFARKTIPVLQRHLKAAQALSKR